MFMPERFSASPGSTATDSRNWPRPSCTCGPAHNGRVLLERRGRHPADGRTASRCSAFPMFRPIAGMWARSRRCPFADNAILGSQRKRTRGIFLRSAQDPRVCGQDWSSASACAAPASVPSAGKLSGGNLQKLILGREIMRDAAAMVVEQPTRGLDVGAVESVWAELLRERERGQGDPVDLRGA